MTRDLVRSILLRVAEDRPFDNQLKNDPAVALEEYELTPEERDQILFCVRRAEGSRLDWLAAARIERSIEDGECTRFSRMSLRELYELAWAAGDLALKPTPRRLPAHTTESFRAWYEEQGARLAHDRKTAPYWGPTKRWAEALLAELEHRKNTSAPDIAAGLEQACARVRTCVEQF
jgi:hypothetical protein